VTIAYAVLALLVVLMAAARWDTYDEPLEMDGATYAVIAREMRAGRHLYTEVWDHKPPAIYVSYAVAQTVVGAGPAHIYVTGLFLAAITLAGVHFAAQQAAGHAAGLAAAVFWSIVGTDLNLQANQPNAEAFINACMIWGFGLLLCMPDERPAYGRAAAIGLLFALASLYKNIAVAAALPLLIAHAAAARFTPRSLAQTALMALVIALSWAAVIVYFAATDRYATFIATVFEFNSRYAGSLWANLAAGLEPGSLAPWFALQLWPLASLSVLGLLLTGGVIPLRARLLLAGLFVGTFAAVALPGRFYPHYYQLWMPPLCVAAACGAPALARILGSRRLGIGVAAAAAVLLAAYQAQNLGLTPNEVSTMKFRDRLVLSRRGADLINRLLTPDELFFQWGHHPELYYYSGRRPAGGEFRSRHLVSGPLAEQRNAQLLRDLEANRPEMVILVAGHAFPQDHPVPRWIQQHYQPLAAAPCDTAVAQQFLFLGRRDGRLQTAVQPGACLSAVDHTSRGGR
jgi:4-amino-4-deoxy-L-arabinose transferase-like glycosyltransferase